MQNSSAKHRQVVAVTGASAGVGRAIAHEFARQGAAIGLISRSQERLEDTAREVEALGGKALILPTDVADASQVEAAAQAIEDQLGPLDVWVNDAMVSVFSPIKRMLPAEYERVTSVTYLGYVYGTLAALKHMLPRNRGTIVQVGSALAHRSIPLQSAYCAAKHAIGGFTESLRCELLHDKSKVTVSVVNLPAMNTPQFEWSRSRMPHRAQPVPPIYQPEVAARAVAYVARHPRRILNVGGSTAVAWFGEKLLPWLGDLYLARTGYESQQTSELERPGRRDNLWETVPWRWGAHGRFDDRALPHSPYTWMNMHRRGIAVAAGTVGLAIAALRKRAATANPAYS